MKKANEYGEKEYILRKFDGRPVCPKCGYYIRLLPEYNLVDMYAYKCACNPPLGWSYVSNLVVFNPLNQKSANKKIEEK